jgi:epoxyqueuosine reductase
MVRAGEVAPVFPRRPRRPRPRPAGGDALRRPRLLDPAAARAAIVADLKREGFDVAGIAAPDAIPEAAARLRAFLADGHHGTMTWLADEADRRADVRALWAQAGSVVMAGMNYGPDCDPLAILAQKDRGAISVYAGNRDYHALIKGKLKVIAGRFKALTGSEVKVFVDTAPLMEKPLAQAAGIGWQGKHTNLVSRQFGSWLFLGAIVTEMELPPDEAEQNSCGTCRACLDVCPTDAFPVPYRLDARRCISYLTIEHDGPIPHEFRKAIGNRIFGCDDCLAVCPWNKFAQAAREAKFMARADMIGPPLAELATLDDAAFRRRFSGSPIKRIGRDRFVRNVMIAVGNSGDAKLAGVVEDRLEDTAPQVRGAAAWALSELMPARFAALAADRRRRETDPDVAAEWPV